MWPRDTPGHAAEREVYSKCVFAKKVKNVFFEIGREYQNRIIKTGLEALRVAEEGKDGPARGIGRHGQTRLTASTGGKERGI